MKYLSWVFVIESVPFTAATIAGETSLGGSESACVGTARALKARGHDVHIFTTRISPDAVGADHTGVLWHDAASFHVINQFIEWDVVVALRTVTICRYPINARMRILWNQDLLVPKDMCATIMSVAWAFDHFAYVSQYHRAQWEDLQKELKPLGWVTKNSYDPSQLPAVSAKDPNRIIHISRPERGLTPILGMWRDLKRQRPDATLQLCRYSSMYDPAGWGEVCKSYDEQVQALNQDVGGITYLGELSKPDLYKAISSAAVMWYPGVSSFAETSCIAAIEAQACGTPFIGSLKGALPETARPAYDAGHLIPCRQDPAHLDRSEVQWQVVLDPSTPLLATDEPEYQAASIAAVVGLLDGCAEKSHAYRRLQKAGLAHARHYTHAIVAEQWEYQVQSWFQTRYQTHKRGILRQLLHEDDHVAAKIVANDILTDDRPKLTDTARLEETEASQAFAFCEYVMAGKDQLQEHYAEQAFEDPLHEAEISGRFQAVIPFFATARRVLDVACGNGSFAIALARAYPAIEVWGVDYADHNIEVANVGAIRAGVADRCHFARVTVYDFDRHTMADSWHTWAKDREPFDGLFCGEFLEHTANCYGVIEAMEALLVDGAPVVYTVPHGAFAEVLGRKTPLRRGHVHRFHYDDLQAMFREKPALGVDYLSGGMSLRGNVFGNWLIHYTKKSGKGCGQRPLWDRIVKTRPLQKLSVGIITKDCEHDLGKCLDSVWAVADELIVGDTGSSDDTKATAKKFGAKVFDLPTIEDHPEGFAGARNTVLELATGDWFLWIDADEQLLGSMALRKYLDTEMYRGLVLHQNHLQLDAPLHHDIPIRVFRKDPKIRFYGCVHEQPQYGDANTDIEPALDAQDVQLVHLGYLTEEIRRGKMMSRNLPLLHRDQQVFKDRRLGRVLLVRESALQGERLKMEARGEMTPAVMRAFVFAVKTYQDHFSDPDDKFHKIARPWYQMALQGLGIGWEFEIALAGTQGPLNGHHAKGERIWVADIDEWKRIMDWKIRTTEQSMRPITFKTDPFQLPTHEEAGHVVVA